MVSFVSFADFCGIFKLSLAVASRVRFNRFTPHRAIEIPRLEKVLATKSLASLVSGRFLGRKKTPLLET